MYSNTKGRIKPEIIEMPDIDSLYASYLLDNARTEKGIKSAEGNLKKTYVKSASKVAAEEAEIEIIEKRIKEYHFFDIWEKVNPDGDISFRTIIKKNGRYTHIRAASKYELYKTLEKHYLHVTRRT